jgi:hypothetical protein
MAKLKRSGKTPQNAAQPRLGATRVFRRRPIAPAVAQSPCARMSIELRRPNAPLPWVPSVRSHPRNAGMLSTATRVLAAEARVLVPSGTDWIRITAENPDVAIVG